MKTDAEILDWMEKNAHRVLMHRGRSGKIRFQWGIRNDAGEYFWQQGGATLREAVSAAIEHDQKGEPMRVR